MGNPETAANTAPPSLNLEAFLKKVVKVLGAD
jgi:hypothetical protein